MENLTLGATTRSLVDRLEHVHVSVADLERSIAFYRDALGFEVRFREVGPHGPCAHVGTDRFYVAMTEDPGVKAAQAAPGHAQVYHFSFTTPDIAAFHQHLERHGIEVSNDVDRKEGRAIYVHDPDGHEIEVVGYEAGYAYR